uniref:Putative major capsid protein n=1 Tax=Dishui Lake virophage TaxID=1797099 RepID=A0A141R7H1_9VIRU|nr:putative major capsid protein [Dishui Lake virophage]
MAMLLLSDHFHSILSVIPSKQPLITIPFPRICEMLCISFSALMTAENLHDTITLVPPCMTPILIIKIVSALITTLSNNVSNDQDFQPRGAFVLDSITGNEPKGSIASNTRNVILTFTTTEPLMLSPFIWCDPKSNNQGMYGVQTLNFVFNLGLPNRIVRLANKDLFDGGVATISLPNQAINNAQLLMEFYTRQPSDLVSSRNVVPFAEYPRYLTPMTSLGALAAYNPQTPLVIPSVSVNFQSIQLNSVPDKLIICCRKVLAQQDAFDSDSFLPITNISINFNNKAGLLSSARQYDLWRMSVESGSNQTWAEFTGFANIGNNVPLSNGPSSGAKRVPTCGSVLCLEMGRHVELDDVYAPGSIGAFQLQFQTTFQNNTLEAIDDQNNQYEIVLITMNSGVFTIERGTSQTYTAILSRADVLSVSSQPSHSKSSVARLVGGSWEDSFKSLCSSIAPYAGKAEKVKDLIMGEGASGGGQSGGRMRKHLAM